MYDVTNRSSFMHISQWLTDAKHLCNANILLVLIGNKIDLHAKREVTRDEARRFAKNNDMLFFETSAKTGQLVQHAFFHSGSIIFDNIQEGLLEVNPNYGVWLNNMSVSKSYSREANCYSWLTEFLRNTICCCCTHDE